jgi:hypothetical protein
MEITKGETAKFKSYPDIENYNSSKIKKLLKKHTTDELWVATEKIHGTNFCFVFNGSVMECAKRTSFLTQTDSFYNYQPISTRCEPLIK